MKHKILYITLLTLFTSCTEVRFTNPQPEGVENEAVFPESLRGIYLDENQDTLTINEKSFRHNEGNNITLIKGVLSDTVLLRKHKNHYVLNTLNDSLWAVIIAKPYKDSLKAFFLDGDDPEKVSLMKNLTQTNSIKDEEGKVKRYILSPTKKEFNLLIKKGVFKRIARYRKVE